MALDFSRCRLPPFQHQREDTPWLLEHPWALIASEMRTGKTKICIDASQFMYEADMIDTVLVIAPAPVRDVWADQVIGEIAKHAWMDLPNQVIEYHARLRTWANMKGIGPGPMRRLTWYVTNYEFIRAKARLKELADVCGPKTLLVLDESSFVKNPSSQQTKACMMLRKLCGRVILLNGTPIFHSPRDLFSQGNLLHPSVLNCPTMTQFETRYAIKEPVLGYGGKPLKTPYGHVIEKVAKWTNLEDLQRRFAPVTVRRLQKDCIDVPPKLEPVVLTATLKESWPAYKKMRDELVVWLKSGQVATSSTAAIKSLRLSQITSGILGGIEDSGIDDAPGAVEDGLIGSLDWTGVTFDGEIQTERNIGGGLEPDYVLPQQIGPRPNFDYVGREKLDVLLWFIEQRLEADPNLHLVAWCRFRAEMFRVLEEVSCTFPQFQTAAIHGGQKKPDRLRALSLLKPETSPTGPVFVVGIEGTGSFGLDFTASHTCVTLSSGYSPGRSAQTLDRVYGPAQKHPIAYYDIVAVGPKGQQTIDRTILLSRRAGQDVASWTAAAWVKALTEE
jgi:hypothetical protein